MLNKIKSITKTKVVMFLVELVSMYMITWGAIKISSTENLSILEGIFYILLLGLGFTVYGMINEYRGITKANRKSCNI